MDGEEKKVTAAPEKTTVFFQECGQAFLEWDIEDSTVVACRPLQEWFWKGTKVNSMRIKPGVCLNITLNNGVRTNLGKYPLSTSKIDSKSC